MKVPSANGLIMCPPCVLTDLAAEGFQPGNAKEALLALQSGIELALYESVPAGVLPPEPVRGCLGDPALTAAQTSR
ncbi:hypothetical protein lerEdw1_007257 [Lerista edwardsae]|nr:hypothetical protein lerEdw1_007258 [Lerista edwardsae]KAJ6650490.1 hypothetical protein lerEdw1_007257 [Lerista edwardsae]